ncbi:ABC transporter permease [Rhodococcoides kyotonense]|uniref:ABC-2 type transport system permease protein n=1 Tax=Rhodococcoides kyotonense TaxID=398843 RepID=A0A239LAH8_9NOCA|nr:ABC transporter permease [Rhodococcus kyotonensis]SNT27290.1 ABC-2 type transport system permease protein [Rhodococcus kyotonensis]
MTAPSSVQWWVLTSRTLRTSVRAGELVTALIAPVVFTIGFYLPLQKVISLFGNGVADFGQFLMPLIALQAIAFTAISAAFLAATDAVDGINTRFASMPVAPSVPFTARVATGLLKCAVSSAAALGCGYVIGFRFSGSAIQTACFFGFVAVIAVALIIGADMIGTTSKSPEATTQILIVPQLILGMLSSGFAPLDQFPEWVQPFVRNQPISQFTTALRGLADGTATGSSLYPAVLWLVGMLLLFVPLSLRVNTRRP